MSFSNLLPAGPLRESTARQAGVPVDREFYLLQHLGEDLPGGARIVADDPLAQGEEATLPKAATSRRADD
jgi:hypothetical protein